MELLYSILRPKIEALIEGASGRYPTWTGMKLNEDLFVSVVQVAKDGDRRGKGTSWAVIFTESDLRGAFDLRRLDSVDLPERCVVRKQRGKEYAADIFTKLTIEKLGIMARKN